MRSLREFKNSKERRDFLEKKLKVKLNPISNFSFSEDEVVGRNIENLIGSAQIPMGVAGPLKIFGEKNQGFYIPIATTEGALVASISRGCKAVSLSGGARVEVENIGVTRGPVFVTSGIEESKELKIWIDKHFEEIKKVAEKTSSHLILTGYESNLTGKNVFVRFYFDTQDAMGMNMATIATQEIADLIEKRTHIKCVSIAGNFDTDKKPSHLNFLNGRGRKLHAEVTLKKSVLEKVLKVNAKDLAEVVYRKCQIGSAMSGSMGFNAHYANIIAGVFIACGQDPAHIVEGSMGITTAEVLQGGSLYFSIYIPSLIVGTVGGGTNLPTQREALQIMGVYGEGGAENFSKILAAAVLAGELSLLASQTEGTLALSHRRLGRKQSV